MIRIVLGCLSLSVLFAALFAADLMGYFNKTSKPVAIVTEAEGTLRRLPQGALVWDHSFSGTLLGAGDTLSTAEDANARVNLYAGADLEMDAGSMVVIVENLDELKLNFISGSGKLQISEKAKRKVKVTEDRPGAPARTAKSQVEVAVVAKLPPVKVQPRPQADMEMPPPEPEPPQRSPAAEPEPEPEPETPPPPPRRKVFAAPIQVQEIKNPESALTSTGGLATAQAMPPVPQIRFPAPDAVIDLGKNSAAELEWTVSDAQGAASLGYEILLRPASAPGEELVFRSDRLKFALSRVASGKYLWAVRSVSASGKRGPASESRSLELRAPVHLSKPVGLPVKVE